ncbi:DNA-binding transcriptional MerR regulator [Pseudochelatococcus lubricantis]|uniref:DNA-binding transcriptional MerR regulator n=1 Tax=Pseudochelatococcus lubricantis TaxID=1538102 RepID=A0ABX0UZH3_9HYPH|nr:MerR family DNA-binding transcriptional regulator [Pseudochelatococcus lubricantis]NIJ57778.1 DNA-binding transcriptional MerR regulator [Pseudochelatococcus lubricantis]
MTDAGAIDAVPEQTVSAAVDGGFGEDAGAPDDRLYSVTELGRELGVSARTLRFYEDSGLIAPRRAGNNRIYSHRDRVRMILILRGKRLGFSLREIREYLDLYDADRTQQEQLRMLLKRIGVRRQSLQEQRIALDEALAELDEIEREARAAMAYGSRTAPSGR